jgi:exodeoxyribonuclease-3
MKLATWNVNSLKVRLPHVLEWLAANQPDVLAIQETKLEDHNFPLLAFQEAGYHATFAGQKTYNGVALISRQVPSEICVGIPGYADEQKRVICATYEDLRVVCGYFPNGQGLNSDKYRYKLDWLSALHGWLADEVARYPRLALLGDYNIAPEPRDVNPEVKDCEVLISEEVRAGFRRLLDLGLKDGYRLFDQPEKSYSWWDYRMMAFRRNLGLRIDHILLSHSMAAQCRSCVIDKAPRKLERPSDHAPVLAEIA